MLDWIYPPLCAGCGAPGARWCPDCHQQAPRVPQAVCPVCGEPRRDGQICATCRISPPAFDAARAWGLHDGSVRHALHRLKYRRDLSLGDALAAEMISLVCSQDWQPQLVVPVPLGKARLKERGYNQAALLARPIALALGIDYLPQSLQRKRETRSQVGLMRHERQRNMRGAFQANETWVAGKNVLLVDDVMTTGATMNAAAVALKQAGACCVWAISFARAA